MKHCQCLCLTLLLGVFLTTPSYAIPPFYPDLVQSGNRWIITFYDDTSPLHTQWATQGICFYYAGVAGTTQLYTWVSDTYPDWNGRAAQEGDKIVMSGDFQWPLGTIDGGHDGMEWEIVTRGRSNDGTGHWQEWVEDGIFGVTIGFGNAKFVRIGFCAISADKDPKQQDPNALDALERYKDIKPGVDKNGKTLTNPMGVDLDARDNP